MGLDGFPDSEGVSDWARKAMARAVSEGVISGVELPDGTVELRAGRNITRAEMAKMMVVSVLGEGLPAAQSE